MVSFVLLLKFKIVSIGPTVQLFNMGCNGQPWIDLPNKLEGFFEGGFGLPNPVSGWYNLLTLFVVFEPACFKDQHVRLHQFASRIPILDLIKGKYDSLPILLNKVRRETWLSHTESLHGCIAELDRLPLRTLVNPRDSHLSKKLEMIIQTQHFPAVVADPRGQTNVSDSFRSLSKTQIELFQNSTIHCMIGMPVTVEQMGHVMNVLPL